MAQHGKDIVIGGSGFIGRVLVQYLHSSGRHVTNLDIKGMVHFDARTQTMRLRDAERCVFLAREVGGSKYLHEPSTQLNQLESNSALLLNLFKKLKISVGKTLFV